MYIKNFYNNNLEKEKQLEESYSLTSDYTTKLQSSQVWYKHKNKYKSMNKTESPEINLHTYGHLIFDKGGKNIQWRKDSLFSRWW